MIPAFASHKKLKASLTLNSEILTHQTLFWNPPQNMFYSINPVYHVYWYSKNTLKSTRIKFGLFLSLITAQAHVLTLLGDAPLVPALTRFDESFIAIICNTMTITCWFLFEVEIDILAALVNKKQTTVY